MKTQKFKILSLRMALLTILLSNLTSGQYTLQMANNQGNYLTGVFGI